LGVSQPPGHGAARKNLAFRSRSVGGGGFGWGSGVLLPAGTGGNSGGFGGPEGRLERHGLKTGDQVSRAGRGKVGFSAGPIAGPLGRGPKKPRGIEGL